jgi:hypothetical protein
MYVYYIYFVILSYNIIIIRQRDKKSINKEIDHFLDRMQMN